ncbi:hypothetical protein [Burkholderia sp. BCC0322]|nr:hypothetical protein [Burkholderia sp. BCC0322]
MDIGTLAHPTIKLAINALQKGDRVAWAALFVAGASLYNDGEPRTLQTFN